MHRLPRIALVLAASVATACKARDSSPRNEESLDLAASPPGAGATAPSRYSSADGAAGLVQQAKPAGNEPPSNTAVADSAAPRMIIRTGTATVEVDRLEPAIARLQQLAQQVGGYVANSAVQGGSQHAREASLELKVPANRWDQVMAGLRPLGKLEAQGTATEDVGEEFVDVSARVANSRRLEQRLVELLGTRTGKLEDVLAVERELARVREEIDRFEGRLRYLRTRVGMSTLTVRLHEPVSVIGGRPGGNPLTRALRDAWDNFVGFVAGLIAMLGWLLPLAAVLGAVAWLFRRFVRWPRAPAGGPAPPIDSVAPRSRAAGTTAAGPTTGPDVDPTGTRSGGPRD